MALGLEESESIDRFLDGLLFVFVVALLLLQLHGIGVVISCDRQQFAFTDLLPKVHVHLLDHGRLLNPV